MNDSEGSSQQICLPLPRIYKYNNGFEVKTVRRYEDLEFENICLHPF